ncbi:DUF3142 domain-containing protein [Parachitinimonas caeni]|nr:DUF3142 domain-containing protein [Parachitinimonas caeni]
MMRRRFWLVLAVLLAWIGLAACSRPPAALPHDAYIWQRQWRPALLQSMASSAGAIRQWRVLAAESDRRGRLQPVAFDAAALRQSGRPVVLVVRIDGQLSQLNLNTLRQQMTQLLAQWRQTGLALSGLEIDHDCATARLSAYADFLAQLKPALAGLPLSITALPAWLESEALPAVLGRVDEVVLQVHAVRNPRQGLFESDQARQWLERFARYDKPFRVALPAYGSRIGFDAAGEVAAVTSEAPGRRAGVIERELVVEPLAVARLLQGLQQKHPANLQGVVWFRLPTAEDQRAWSLSGWLRVVQGQPLQAEPVPLLEAGDVPGLYNLILLNRGNVDAGLPPVIQAPASCELADALAGYSLQLTPAGWQFERQQAGLLAPGMKQRVGWLRCASPPSLKWPAV